MKIALIFGSSGLIGNQLLKIIYESKKYSKIKIFVRSKPKVIDPNIEIIYTDFLNIKNNKEKIVGDDCFFCIGTTKKNTPNNKEYKRIEYEIPVEVAQIAKSNSVNSFYYVSSLGANTNSSGLYLKYKGQVEEVLKNLDFSKLSIIRPSILLGPRDEIRIGEKLGKLVMQIMSPLFIGSLKKYKPIQSAVVAKSILKISQNNYKNVIFESDKLQEIGNE
tara:strand:+ start:325 stop:981 length:657 start_codon:yes stop_codon:yes gene_type:complete